MAWAASSLFWTAEALLLVTFQTSYLPVNPAQTSGRVLEKEEDCGSTNSQSDPKEAPKFSHHRRRNKHISHNRPQAHPSESQAHSQTSHQDSPTSHTKKHHSSSNPHLNLNKMSKASAETKKQPTHLLSNTHHLVLFFLAISFILLFSYPKFAHFFSDFLVSLLLSSFPTRSSLSQLLRKFSSYIALYSLTTSPSSLGNAPLSCNFFSRKAP